MSLTAKQIMDVLNLEPHPTCGFAAFVYQSKQRVPRITVPANYEEVDHYCGSMLYFMVTPGRRLFYTGSDPTRCIITTSAIHWRYFCFIREGAEK